MVGVTADDQVVRRRRWRRRRGRSRARNRSSAESAPSRTNALSSDLFAVSRKCSNCALGRDLAQRLLDAAHHHHEPEQHEREQSSVKPIMVTPFCRTGRRRRRVLGSTACPIPSPASPRWPCKRRARRINRELADALPRRPLRAGLHHAARVVGGDDPVRPVHRQARQRGHAGRLRALPHRRRLRGRRARRAGGADPADRLLPQQDDVADQAGDAARRAVRRRGAEPVEPTSSRCPASAARQPTSSSATPSASPG